MSTPLVPAISTLHTDRLLLRAVETADLDLYHARIFADPEVMRYLPGGEPLARERLEGLVERSHDHWSLHGYGVWIVCEGGSGELIGQCGLRYLEEIEETELLYAIGAQWWGRGLTTEAATSSMAFGFDRSGLDRIVALAVPENVASLRVMEKLGMTLEGRSDLFGMRLVRYATSRQEWDAAHPRKAAGRDPVSPA